jgi:aminoglycoside 2'-N-acetyltransferase I
MEIIIKHANELTENESNQLDLVSSLAYAGDVTDLVWCDECDWIAVGKVDGEVVSILNIVDRQASVGERPVRLGGIGGVATHPDLRGKGYAAQVMEAAARFMADSMGVDFGLLVCHPRLIPYYSRLGWQVVQGPLMADQPQGKVTMEHIVMILPCVRKAWPPGAIDLCGLPW